MAADAIVTSRAAMATASRKVARAMKECVVATDHVMAAPKTADLVVAKALVTAIAKRLR